MRRAGWAFRRFAPALVSMTLGAGLGGAVVAIFSHLLTDVRSLHYSTPLLLHVPPDVEASRPTGPTAAHTYGLFWPGTTPLSQHTDSTAAAVANPPCSLGVSCPEKAQTQKIIFSEPLGHRQSAVSIQLGARLASSLYSSSCGKLRRFLPGTAFEPTSSKTYTHRQPEDWELGAGS